MTDALIQIFTGFIGSCGFALLYNIRGIRFWFAGLGGLLSWSFYLTLNTFIPNEFLCYFIVAVLISVYAEIMARFLKTPTTTFIMTSLIPLVPGSALYYTMTHAFSGNVQGFIEKGIQTVGLAGALAAGIITVAGFMRLILQKNSDKK
ncbi:MAG: threonine/serine exporter family protein [Acutalibacteraceae bacterium]|nr:threonine/serine exporter family protein [Acutalibacteraceae bacterium]